MKKEIIIWHKLIDELPEKNSLVITLHKDGNYRLSKYIPKTDWANFFKPIHNKDYGFFNVMSKFAFNEDVIEWAYFPMQNNLIKS